MWISGYMLHLCHALYPRNPSNFVVRQSIMVWMLTTVTLLISVIDIAMNMAYPEYESLVYLLIDCMVSISCNFIAFSPAHYFMQRLCCGTISNRSLNSHITSPKLNSPRSENPPKVTSPRSDAPKEIVKKIEEDEEMELQVPSTPNNTYDQAIQSELGIPRAPKSPNAKARSPKATPEFFNLSENGTVEITLQTQASAITSMATEFTDAVAVTCPSCGQKIRIEDDDDKWTVLKLHIKAFHID